MNKKGHPKTIFIYLFFLVQIGSAFSQDDHALNPREYLTGRKFNHEIKSIKEAKYQLFSDDEGMDYDTAIIVNEEEFTLKRNSYSYSEFVPNREIATYYDNNGNKKTIWTFEYDNNDNLLCSILNHKEGNKVVGDWTDSRKGFKYCQSFDKYQRIDTITQQNGIDSIQINAIVSYREDGFLNTIYLGFPWGDAFQVFQAKDHRDTIRYFQSFEFTKETGNKTDRKFLEKEDNVYIDLIKEKGRFVFNQMEVNRKSNNVVLVEKQIFDEEWNQLEGIQYRSGKIIVHKIYTYNQENQIVESKDLISSRSETYKYDNIGNLIFVDNNYLLMYKKYDESNNMILDCKINKDTGILKEISIREITYRDN